MTITRQYECAAENLAAHRYEAIVKRIDSCVTTAYPPKDRVLYHLDVGMLRHMTGQYDESNRNLTDADRGIEQAFTKSVTRAAGSMLLNDNMLDYAGEDYENIYLHVFKALNYLQQDQSDKAFVEVRRMNEKLNLLEDRYRSLAAQYNRESQAGRKFQPGRNPFQNSALARYMSMLLYRTEGKMDDARIDLQKIADAWRTQPALYPFPMPNLEPMLKPSTLGRLTLFAFTGRSPEKRAMAFHLHSVPNAIIVGLTPPGTVPQKGTSVDTIAWPGMTPGINVKFEVPTMFKRESRVARVRVTVDGKSFPMDRIESLDSAALETFKVRRPMVYLRSVVRSAAKAFAAYKINKEFEDSQKKKAKEKPGVDDAGDMMKSLALSLATGIAVEATENADLRISQFLPGQAYVGEILLTPGQHNVCIEYLPAAGVLLYRERLDGVLVSSGKLNVIESCHLN
jgi:hypothetical protein